MQDARPADDDRDAPRPDAPAGPPPGPALLERITGAWQTHAIAAAARLGVADAVGETPETVEAIAAQLGVHAPSLRRLLRALASLGIFAEQPDGRFAHTPTSRLLRADTPGSLRGMALHVGSRAALLAWSDLAGSVRTGEPAFRRVHGCSFFEHLETSEDEARAFDHAMHGVSSTEIPAVLDAVDLGGLDSIVDVGGGDGTFLEHIVARHARPRAVLADLPHVVEAARARLAGGPYANRFAFAAASFFDAVPEGGDAYLLKHILHDWDDERSLRILANCRRAMKPASRIFVVEAVLQPGNDPHFGKILDLEMIALTEGGRERSETEFEQLLRDAGLALEAVIPTRAPTSVVEARPA